LAELTWRCGQNHTVELFPRLDSLEPIRIDISATDCVFVARGPGSFNGLRVGVGAAKGLAFSLGIPIIGISTLEIAAYQHAEIGLPVCAVQNAGREEIAASIYQQKRNKWHQILVEQITTVNALSLQIQEKTVFCGEINAATSAQIKKLLKTKAIIPAPAAQLRRAGF
jgi:tRNA threonylcarbamoyl adenosine modification protein YeaZ